MSPPHPCPAAHGRVGASRTCLKNGLYPPNPRIGTGALLPLGADTYDEHEDSKGYNAIALYDAANLWVKNVRRTGKNGTAAQPRGHSASQHQQGVHVIHPQTCAVVQTLFCKPPGLG